MNTSTAIAIITPSAIDIWAPDTATLALADGAAVGAVGALVGSVVGAVVGAADGAKM